jgi:alkylation response protein AidB-like acyl-CoA dehydrogenase
MRCHANRDGSDFVLHGSKMWITNAPLAHDAVVFANKPNSRTWPRKSSKPMS